MIAGKALHVPEQNTILQVEEGHRFVTRQVRQAGRENHPEEGQQCFGVIQNGLDPPGQGQYQSGHDPVPPLAKAGQIVKKVR